MTRPSRRFKVNPEAPASTPDDNGPDGIDWDTSTIVPTSVTVEESDGTPSVVVHTLKVDAADFTLVDDGSGVATLTTDEPDAAAHIADATDAHDASAVSFVPTGTIAATNVQDAIAEVAAEATGGGGVTVQDEGSPLTTTATTLNFTGAGVTASGSGATKTIAIPGGTASFPASVEGLFAHYKADAITGKSNGDTLTEWRNSAPLTPGLDLIAIGSPTYQTNVLNSLPVVRFGGAAYFAHNLGAPLMMNKPWTIFIVHKLSSIAPAYSGLWGFGISDAGGIFVKSNGKSAVYAPGSIYDGTGAITYGTTNWNYTTGIFGPTLTTRRNAAADITTATMAINGSLQGMGYLGNQAVASRVFSGDIAEVLLYARVLTSTEITAVEGYITGKYAL